MDGDLELFFEGVERRLISPYRGGKFNTFDRPRPGGRWSLLSRGRDGGWYNAEYLPQLAAYVDAIVRGGYPKDRLFFELPPDSLQLDLAIVDDECRVVVLGEAKREVRMLDRLLEQVLQRFGQAPPPAETKRRGDEVRQLAWRIWSVRPAYVWLIAPGARVAYECSLDPLLLRHVGELPPAAALKLDYRPSRPLAPPQLLRS